MSSRKAIIRQLKRSETVRGFKYDAVSKSDNKLTFAELLDVQVAREEILEKQKDLNAVRIATSLVGTVFPRVQTCLGNLCAFYYSPCST